MAATKNGTAKTNGKSTVKKLVLPPEVKKAKLEVSFLAPDGTVRLATVGLPMAIAKNIVVNTNTKKSILKSERGGPSDLLVVKLAAK